jgi:hypothetical protein
LLDVVSAATKTTAWEGSDGIITEGTDSTEDNDGVGFKGVFHAVVALSQLTRWSFSQLYSFVV